MASQAGLKGSEAETRLIRNRVSTEQEAISPIRGPELLETRECHREPWTRELPSEATGAADLGGGRVSVQCQGLLSGPRALHLWGRLLGSLR